MATYSFKSVGELATSHKYTQKKESVPIGLKTPMEISQQSDGIFRMHFSLEDQIQDNLRNLILTNHGDRLGRYDFGANLNELCTELGSQEADFEAISRIGVAIKKFMPFVEPESFSAFPDQSGNEFVGKVKIRLIYNVPTLGIKNKSIDVFLYVAG